MPSHDSRNLLHTFLGTSVISYDESFTFDRFHDSYVYRSDSSACFSKPSSTFVNFLPTPAPLLSLTFRFARKCRSGRSARRSQRRWSTRFPWRCVKRKRWRNLASSASSHKRQSQKLEGRKEVQKKSCVEKLPWPILYCIVSDERSGLVLLWMTS